MVLVVAAACEHDPCFPTDETLDELWVGGVVCEGMCNCIEPSAGVEVRWDFNGEVLQGREVVVSLEDIDNAAAQGTLLFFWQEIGFEVCPHEVVWVEFP